MGRESGDGSAGGNLFGNFRRLFEGAGERYRRCRSSGDQRLAGNAEVTLSQPPAEDRARDRGVVAERAGGTRFQLYRRFRYRDRRLDVTHSDHRPQPGHSGGRGIT